MLFVPVLIPYSHPGQTQGTPRSNSAALLGAGPRTLLKRPSEFSNLLAGHHHTPAVVQDYLESPLHRGDGSTRPKLLCSCQHPSSAFLETLQTDWYRKRILPLGAGLPAGQEHKGETWLVWKFKCLRAPLVKLVAVVGSLGERWGEKNPQLPLTWSLLSLLKHRAARTLVGKGRSSCVGPRSPQILE